MNLTPDDPRLTAYAFGEITDPAELKAIEAAIAAKPELRQTVEAIHATAATLEQALSAENKAGLDAGAEAAMFAAATGKQDTGVKTRRLIRFPVLWPLLGAAAAVVLLIALLIPTGDAPRQIALDEVPVHKPAETHTPASDLDPRSLDTLFMPPGTHRSESDPSPSQQISSVEFYVDGASIGQNPLEGDAPSSPQTAPAPRMHIPAPMMAPAARPAVVRTRAVADSRAPHPEAFRQRTRPWNTDAFDPIEETGFRSPRLTPLSTFAIDVDTASYAVVRSHLERGVLPPHAAVRIEELVNYFPYADAPPATPVDEGGEPFAVHIEQAPAPWAPDHPLLRINLKGYEMPWDQRPPSNLVFLIDVSGSMNRPNRLPLVKDALGLLVERLDERDRVAIVVYAGNSQLTLPSTTANNRETIRHAIDQLVARGSTHASDGIQRAYKIARQHFIEGGNNRVILCTDGDFNVGITDRGELGDFVKKQADDGVSLAVLGFGMGNYKDNMLEHLSNKGSGVYGYIDSQDEARKFFLNQLVSNLFSIAHDVRIQVEFNPERVAGYRLIGYENRLMQAEDFHDDSKRAGQIGPGHTVTAFYEIIPAKGTVAVEAVDPLRYHTPAAAPDAMADELAWIKIRYKRPGEHSSELIELPVPVVSGSDLEAASADFRFGAAVAAFGMRLRESEHTANFSWRKIETLARSATADDPHGYRGDFLRLVRQAQHIADPN